MLFSTEKRESRVNRKSQLLKLASKDEVINKILCISKHKQKRWESATDLFFIKTILKNSVYLCPKCLWVNFYQYWLNTDSSTEFQDSEYTCVSEEIRLHYLVSFSNTFSWCNQMFVYLTTRWRYPAVERAICIKTRLDDLLRGNSMCTCNGNVLFMIRKVEKKHGYWFLFGMQSKTQSLNHFMSFIA